MKKRFLIATFAMFPAIACADGVAVALKGGTLGLGVELVFPVASNVTARIGANAFNYNHGISESGIDYDARLRLRSVSALADWYPAEGVFRLSAGIIGNNSKFDLTGKPSAGSTFTINNTTYSAAQVGSVTGDVTFNKAAPYIGIGWGNPVAKGRGWSFVADVGVLYQRSPKAALRVTCGAAVPAATCNQLQSDVAAEQNQLRDSFTGTKYEWYPVLSVGASYQF